MLPRTILVDKSSSRIRWDKLDNNSLRDVYQNPLAIMLYPIENKIRDSTGNAEEINSFFDEITEALHKAAENVPKTKFRSNLKPYWTDELTRLKKDKMFWFEKWKGEGRTCDDNNQTRINMKLSKKHFAKTLRVLSRQYEDQKIADAARYSEIDRDAFWRMFKQSSVHGKTSVNAIKNEAGTVVYELKDILVTWQKHFDALSTPTNPDRFDDDHQIYVSNKVSEWTRDNSSNEFLERPLNDEEVFKAIQKLNLKKAPGFDGITSEHLRFAGRGLSNIMCSLLNLCIRNEYVPKNFRKGIQVPLYKGKKSCPLNTNNYRGITLLSTFNKLFEVIIWARLSGWWFNERKISDLQGAGRKGSSCIHTALSLQETIAKERESNKNVFVAYYDVSKAFDSVWIDGLFFQLHNMGITGSLWRILYKTYQNFKCCVRIEWYDMSCGIHQGGYLSLVKYAAFINSLITNLEDSDLCSRIYRVKTSPVGYADDVAACTVSKRKMDLVMTRVYSHSCVWRYSFNAEKSAVLVFGESANERKIGTKNRIFKLGPDRVKERLYYDHVGVKTCVLGDTHVRTEEKITKTRKVLNMATSFGIKKGGLNLSTCNVIFWSVIMSVLCFGCEVWVIKPKDTALLIAFQRYAARRMQRFHPRSLNITSFVCLGWHDIMNIIKVKKLIFIRTILNMREYMPLRKIFIERVNDFRYNDPNEHDSPIVQMLQYCEEFEVMHHINEMIMGNMPSKVKWKELLWAKVRSHERMRWEECQDIHLDLIKLVMTQSSYVIWWMLSDYDRRYMRRCEVMIRLLCHTSLLKSDDVRYKRATVFEKMCYLCDLGAMECANHVIMQCPFHNQHRTEMFREIDLIWPNFEPTEIFSAIMGKPIEGVPEDVMCRAWMVGCTFITRMYWTVIRKNKENIM